MPTLSEILAGNYATAAEAPLLVEMPVEDVIATRPARRRRRFRTTSGRICSYLQKGDRALYLPEWPMPGNAIPVRVISIAADSRRGRYRGRFRTAKIEFLKAYSIFPKGQTLNVQAQELCPRENRMYSTRRNAWGVRPCIYIADTERQMSRRRRRTTGGTRAQ